MGYREDVRTPCAACSKALDREDVVLDENGRSLCKHCAAREGTAKADQTISIERGKKMTRVGIGITVAIAVGALLTWRTIETRRENERNDQIRAVQHVAHERMQSLGDRVYELSKSHAAAEGDKHCDDAALKRLARDGGQEFLTFRPWQYGRFGGYPKSVLAAEVERASMFSRYYGTPAELRKAVAEFDAGNLVVVYAPRDPDQLKKAREQGEESWPPVSGTLFVMGIEHLGRAHCWAHLRDEKEQPVRADLRAALARITVVLDLAPDS